VREMCLVVSGHRVGLRDAGNCVYHGRMTKIQCEGILFDLDGVLVDSTPAVARVWSWWARKHGFDPDETVRRAHGRPSIATIRDLCQMRTTKKRTAKWSGVKLKTGKGWCRCPARWNCCRLCRSSGGRL